MDMEVEALKEANNLTKEEYDSFLSIMEQIPSPRAPINGKIARLCYEFMEDTGLRVNETIHVKKKDVDFSTRLLTVTMPKVEKRCKCSQWKNKNEYSNVKILEYADPACKHCHGKGKWKKPQTTTITPRIMAKLYEYCTILKDEDYLFPISRQSLWVWAKEAGNRANIRIFQKKEERIIKGLFVHFFRALCSKRMKADASNDQYRDELVHCKLRWSYDNMADRYTKIDINYLLNWEERTYK